MSGLTIGAEGMSKDPRLPGRHRCKSCGDTWRCRNESCAKEENRTLECLRCGHRRAEADLDRAKTHLAEAKRRNFRVEDAEERYQSAVRAAERLRGAMEITYGGFSA